MARRAILGCLLLSTACAPSFVGTWEEQNPPPGVTGELILEEDQTGEYEREAEIPETGAKGGVVYDVEWTEFSDKVELDFDCDELTGDLANLTCADFGTLEDFACEFPEGERDILHCEYDAEEGGRITVRFDRTN